MSTETHEAKPAEEKPQAADAGVLTAISRAELDQQITTARAFPRSIKQFVDECMSMATLNERVASQCFYVLPARRGGGGEPIEGPSARMAEIVASAWGNCRAGAQVVEEGPEFVTARGVFHDLERNVSITMDVRRRITTKTGQRYSADMIAVTGNAACSIALRNAVFKGIPKAFWEDIYQAARKAAVGDIKTLAANRAAALGYCAKMGIQKEAVLGALGVPSVEDIGLEHLATLKGLLTAIKEGETTIEQAFRPPAPAGTSEPSPKGLAGLKEKLEKQP